MGIPLHATVAEAWSIRRRRRHRDEQLQAIELILQTKQQGHDAQVEYKVLWKSKGDTYKPRFGTKETWNYLRSPHLEVTWHRSIWFAYATPRYAFCAWLAVHNWLSTGERMAKWSSGINTGCSFCQDPVETREHLLYFCLYYMQIWTSHIRGLLGTDFTAEWNGIMELISDSTRDHLTNFITKYVFQLSIHTIW